jgi:predicted transcriptional regulator
MARRSRKAPDFRGDLQAEVMAAVWRLGDATVEQVRAEQPLRRRSAYTTIQTVLNRLVDRGLLARQRRGNAYVYSATYDEADYLAKTIGERLAEASPAARRAALVNLVGRLEPAELDEVARYANRIKRTRGKD